MKRILVLCFLFLSGAVFAANIEWGAAFLREQEDFDGKYDLLVTMGKPYLQMGLTVLGDSIVVTAIPDSNLVNANCFDLANKGDVVDSEYMNGGRYFAYAELGEWDSARTDYKLTFNPGDSYYLAFVEARFDEPLHYGWVHLGMAEDSRIVLLGSAMDLDGDPIVVGAIPEPSSGVLLLLGVAGLAMRRRRMAGSLPLLS